MMHKVGKVSLNKNPAAIENRLLKRFPIDVVFLLKTEFFSCFKTKRSFFR